MRRIILYLVVAALLVAAMPATTALAAKPAGTKFVPATAGWVDTGIAMTAGDTVEIEARGQAITGPLRFFPGARSDADGQVTICPDAGGPPVGCYLDGVPYGALVGMIGGSPFLVGASFSGPAPDSGTLWLAVNDNVGFSDDNAGGFAAQVRIGS